MDLIFFNGRVVTMDQNNPLAEAVAIEGSQIASVGSDRDILALKEGHTDVIDLKGRTLLPGFNDSHMHLLVYALNRAKVDLRFCESIEDVIEKIRLFISENGVVPGEWVLGWGWDQGRFQEKKMPDRHDLDRASTEHQLVMTRTCCHVLSANSAALEKAGLEKQSPGNIAGGNVEVDAAGTPTGVLEEKAMQLLTNVLPPFDTDALKDLIKTAAGDFIAAGLTSVQTDELAALDYEYLPILFDAYHGLEADGELPLRVNLQLLLPDRDKLQDLLDQGYRTGQGSNYFKIGPLKLLTDGSIGGRTAYLGEPYLDSPETHGIAVLSYKEIEELVEMAYRNQMQVAAHAIGDAAITMLLDIYRDVSARHQRSDPRFRIVHASLTNQAIVERFAKQDILADIQPAFIASDYEVIEQCLGSERAAWAYPWKSFFDKGIKMGCGTDCPVEHYDPLENIITAVTRQDKEGNPPGGWHPEQRLILDQVLQLYTAGSAYCSYEENIKGTVTSGKLADLVVLSEDITDNNLDTLKKARVDLTVVDGRIVYTRVQ